MRKYKTMHPRTYVEPSPVDYIYNGLDKKKCSKCGRLLPVHRDFFQRQKSNGHVYYRCDCRSCRAKVERIRHAAERK